MFSFAYCSNWGTFLSCSSLTQIDVDEQNETFKSIDENLYTKDGTTFICYAIGKKDTFFAVPDDVTKIDYYAFFDCTSLESVVIGKNVTIIDLCAFEYCTSLKSVTLPSALTYMLESFSGCTSLMEIYYNGTKAQWETIEKDSFCGWDCSTPSYTIHCTDGDIQK